MASQALLKAVTSARFTQARLMLRMGADVNVKDAEGRTPIMRALCLPQGRRVRAHLLRLLLNAGSQVSVSDRQKRNALMWACTVGSAEDVSLLLHDADMDFNINAQNSQGQTALWIAVHGDRVDIVQELIKVLTKHDLNLEVEDRGGVTPAQLAAKLGHLDCLRVMISHLNSLDRSVNTLVNMAKLSKISKSVGITNGPKSATEMTRPQQETSLNPIQELPTIQVTSAEGRQILSHTPQPKNEIQYVGHPVASLVPLQISSKSSTSTRSGQCSVSRSSSHDDSQGRATPAEHNAPHEYISPRLPRLGDTLLVENGSSCTDHDSLVSSAWRRSRSSSDLNELLSLQHSEVVVFPPVTRLRQEKSARHTLPELFQIHSQELSLSFRKKAVAKPPPPKPRPRSTFSKWSKLRGVTLMASLRKQEGATGFSALAAAAAAAAAANDANDVDDTSDGSTSAPGGMPPAGGLAKLFLPRARLSGTLKQRSGL